MGTHGAPCLVRVLLQHTTGGAKSCPVIKVATTCMGKPTVQGYQAQLRLVKGTRHGGSCRTGRLLDIGVLECDGHSAAAQDLQAVAK